MTTFEKGNKARLRNSELAIIEEVIDDNHFAARVWRRGGKVEETVIDRADIATYFTETEYLLPDMIPVATTRV